MNKVILSGAVGNALEWYDFALYGQMALIIGSLFFPGGDPALKTLAGFGVFAVGFVARPFGGAVFGMLGDIVGRKRSLTLSILIMAACTGLIGLLPTYEQIGVAAPVILTLIRIVQGLSVGGEFAGAITYITEHAPEKRRGLVGSTTMMSLVAGFILGSLVAASFAWMMPKESFESWGWRIPFLLGACLGLIGLYIRRSCGESPVFEEALELGLISKTPVREAFLNHPLLMARGVGVYFLVTMPFYMVAIYFISFNRKIFGMDFGAALTLNIISMLAMLAMVPVSAWISDRYGRARVMMISSFVFLAFAIPLFRLIPAHAEAQILLALMVGFNIGPVPAWLVELFPARVRNTGMGISYNIAGAAFGGTTPLVCEWLLRQGFGPESFGYYVTIAALASAISLLQPLKALPGR